MPTLAAKQEPSRLFVRGIYGRLQLVPKFGFRPRRLAPAIIIGENRPGIAGRKAKTVNECRCDRECLIMARLPGHCRRTFGDVSPRSRNDVHSIPSVVIQNPPQNLQIIPCFIVRDPSAILHLLWQMLFLIQAPGAPGSPHAKIRTNNRRLNGLFNWSSIHTTCTGGHFET